MNGYVVVYPTNCVFVPEGVAKAISKGLSSGEYDGKKYATFFEKQDGTGLCWLVHIPSVVGIYPARTEKTDQEKLVEKLLKDGEDWKND